MSTSGYPVKVRSTKRQNFVDRINHHCILLIFDCLDGNLGQEIIVEKMRGQMGFDRQTFCEEFLVKVFPFLLTHENTATSLVFGWSACAPHHLKYIHDRIVHVSMLLALVVLHTHDNHHIARNRKTPGNIL